MTTFAGLVALLIGGGLSLFGFGRWMIAPAAWIAPALLLYFARATEPAWGALLIWLTLTLAIGASTIGIIPARRPGFLGIVALIAAVSTIPYVADRLLGPDLPGFASTLAFPLAWVAVEYLSARLNPLPTWGSLAYTQASIAPLVQLVAVGGMWTLTFLVAWFGSTANWAIATGIDTGEAQRGLLAYGAVLAAAFLAGGLRLALATTRPEMVVAAIHWPEGIITPAEIERAVVVRDLPREDRQIATGLFRRVQDELFARSERAATAGATVITWPESSALATAEDAPALRDRAARFAQEHGIVLAIGLGTIHAGESKPYVNSVAVFGPDGPLLETIKTHEVPGLAAQLTALGTGEVATAATRLGRIGGMVCLDLDFPWLAHQLGERGVDLVTVPASDWPEIGDLHATMARYRAVENGTAMVRSTRWGVSVAVDAFGRVYGWEPDGGAGDGAMIAQLPIGRARTLYGLIGDAGAWLALAGLLVVVARHVLP